MDFRKKLDTAVAVVENLMDASTQIDDFKDITGYKGRLVAIYTRNTPEDDWLPTGAVMYIKNDDGPRVIVRGKRDDAWIEADLKENGFTTVDEALDEMARMLDKMAVDIPEDCRKFVWLGE